MIKCLKNFKLIKNIILPSFKFVINYFINFIEFINFECPINYFYSFILNIDYLCQFLYLIANILFENKLI
jgi:hypothetical protein